MQEDLYPHCRLLPQIASRVHGVPLRSTIKTLPFYTFTPGAGQCAVPTTFNVTVNPNTIPIFSIGPSLSVCNNGTVPTLPTTSDNGVNGTWNPAVIDNHNPGTYIFTPAGRYLCFAVQSNCYDQSKYYTFLQLWNQSYNLCRGSCTGITSHIAKRYYGQLESCHSR